MHCACDADTENRGIYRLTRRRGIPIAVDATHASLAYHLRRLASLKETSIGFSVKSWLVEQGLGRYADLFAASQIDGDALALLTDDHLRELGIPVGPRVKLLAAIRRLSEAAIGPADGGERRRLTVMFVDLVGSTALSQQLDPEDLRDLLRGYQRTVSAVVAEHGGHVARFIGDGVLAYFGYPNAHEHDAERAVRAALAIVHEVGRLESPTGDPLAAHIGIATGLVVAGDLLLAGAASERSALGDAPNLAARLVELAAPGKVVISAQTWNLTRFAFDFTELEPKTVKGLSRPVTAYIVRSERAAETRFEAQRGNKLTPMVGRREALGMLSRLWERARTGNGQVVVLTGEAGIGKSRMLRALRDGLASEPHLQVVNQCSPFHSDSALYPMVRQLVQASASEQASTTEAKLDRIERLLHGAPASDIWLIARLLGLDAGGRFAAVSLTPEQQRQRTFEALLGQLERASRSAPVLWILEDAHWIDPTTQELVTLCAQRIQSLPILAIVTARPEAVPAIGGAAHITNLTLERLGLDDVASIVRHLAGEQAMPHAVVREIAARSDGIPLYVEELTKTVIDSPKRGATGEIDVVGQPDAPLTVPASLHDSIMARLDRHPTLKEVAQIAACIGREFMHDQLAQIIALPEPALRQALEGLESAQLIRRSGGAIEGRYVFKHALLRDVAYESLLKVRRIDIHGRIHAVLASDPAAAAEVLARHADEANLKEQAIDHWERAGVLAMAKPAYQEAMSHIGHALRLVHAMEPNPAWSMRRLQLLLLLGQATIPLRGYSHPQSLAVFVEAERLASELPQAPQSFAISYAMWVIRYVRGEHDKAFDVARRMCAAATRAGSDSQQLTALRTLGISQMIRGDPIGAHATFEGSDELAVLVRRQTVVRRIAVAQRFGADPEIATQFHVALTLWAIGKADDALALASRTVEAARAMGHVHTLGHALAHGAIVAVVARDAHNALALSSEAIDLANEHDMDLWRGYGAVLNGYAHALLGNPAAAAKQLHAGLERLERTETGTMAPVHRAVYACTLAKLGHLVQADRIAEQVRDELDTGTERYFWPDSWCWLGEYLRCRRPDDRDAAERAFLAALTCARAQRSISWELSVVTRLAGFWAEAGLAAQALEVLAPAVAAFERGNRSRQIQEAVRLIATLRGASTNGHST